MGDKPRRKRKSKKQKVCGRIATSGGIPYCNVQARLPDKEDFEELDAILYSESVLESDIVDTYPDLRKMSKRDQLMLAGRALGLSLDALAEGVGMSKMGVLYALRRLDPDQKIVMTKEAKEAYMSQIIDSRALNAVREITNEKLKESSARELSQIAKNLSAMGGSGVGKRSRRINPGRMESLLAELDKERDLGIADVNEIEESIGLLE